ncbi:UBP-type zinc finger domain-containing protein [Pseudonocardia sp.]|uniref:UBP-type zinc finger domain-containing protein n=1 Tax=Pseudonocardia sp. TaxID=60912 RepID=UPI003D134F03
MRVEPAIITLRRVRRGAVLDGCGRRAVVVAASTRPTRLPRGPAVPDCSHLAEIRDVAPSSRQGCTDCLAQGRQTWAHLRECLTCWHVACCDSSPFRHASAHHDATGHPVMASFEPVERWRWCYVDSMIV